MNYLELLMKQLRRYGRNVFEFLPLIVQYWDADEEFPAVLKFMADENIQDFMHFETVMFMLGHVLPFFYQSLRLENSKITF